MVRVSTYVDVTRVAGARPLLIRLRTKPGGAFQVAAKLADRDDASSVSVLEGSDDVVSLLLPRDRKAIRQLLFHELPAIDGVEAINATSVLKLFRSGYDWHAGILSPEIVAELTVAQADQPGTDPVVLSEDDDRLITLLARDGRAPVTRLAESLGATPQTVRRRVDTLLGLGALHVRTEVVPSLFGFNVEALAWLRVPASRIEAVGETLASRSCVRFCAVVTGTSQLLIDALFPDEGGLYDFLTAEVGMVQGAEIAEALVVIAPVRRGPLTVLDGEYDQ